MNSKLFARYALRETLGLVMMGVALFWSAGTLAWWQGWALMAVMFVWIAATAFILLRIQPELLAERLGPRKGAKTWDTVIMSLLGLLQLARYIIAGLDVRYAWTGGFPLPVNLFALLVCIFGYDLLFVWATASNAYFSQIVRIQTERGHTVVDSGPYHYVRHPGYLGAILFELAVGFLLGSWWVVLISGTCALLLIVRTALEDHTLQTELTGYSDYSKTVRYRLLPGIW